MLSVGLPVSHRPGNRTRSPAMNPATAMLIINLYLAPTPPPGHARAAALRAEHYPRRGDGHALCLELLGELQARGHPAHVALLLGGDQGDPRPGGSCPRRSPHPVHVADVVGRRVVVDDVG